MMRREPFNDPAKIIEAARPYMPCNWNPDGRCDNCKRRGVATLRMTNNTVYSATWSCDQPECIQEVARQTSRHG